MTVIDWLLSIEDKVVLVIGTNSILDLRMAILGYMEAERYSNGNTYDPFFPGFQKYVEHAFDVKMTARSWARLIAENTQDSNEAIAVFYSMLRDYVNTLEQHKHIES